MIGVYSITAPDNRVYVGASKNIEKRWSEHHSLRSKSQRVLIKSFKKYGVENHVFKILEECDLNILKDREVFFGIKHQVLNRKFGLNLELPRDKNGNGGAADDKIRIYGNTNAKGLIPWNKGRNDLKSSWNKGKKWSAESKRKMSESSKGSIAWNSKIVMCLETGIFYKSSTEAAKLRGFRRTTLQAMLSGVNTNKTSLIYV